MDPLFAIAEAVARSWRDGHTPVLATLVRVLGSGFRAPGARMLIGADGACIGDLSGGCLDGDVVARARGANEPQLLVYDGETIADLAGGFGVGCPRRVEILLQPLRSPSDFPAPELLALNARRGHGWLAVACLADERAEVGVGRHLLFVEGDDAPPKSPFDARQLVARVEQTRPAALVAMEAGPGTTRFFVERIEPSLRLLLLGGTTIVEPLVRFARTLGWEVVALQSRTDRNPPADGLQIRHVQPSRLADEVQLDARTYVVTMEHNQDRDLAWLREVLPSPVPYVGLLGSRKRVGRMLEALAGSDRGLSEHDRRRLHGPIGLDIGAATPAEIALAVAAEVQAMATGASTRPKRELLEPASTHHRSPS